MHFEIGVREAILNPLTDQVSKALFRKEQRLFSYLHRGIFMGWILGLTGGAGSGKSTAAAILAEMGYPVVDADQVSRALTAAGGEAMPEIIRVFGSAMAAPDGALDRPKMRELVFRDKDARRKLEAIVHTKLAVRVDRLLYEVHKDAPVVIYDCPLLIESPAARERADRILVIDAPEALQIERLRTRSGLSPEAAKCLLAAQASRRERLLAADDVIMNDCTKERFEGRVRSWAEEVLPQIRA